MRDTGSRKVVDDSDDEGVVETKPPAPTAKPSSQPYDFSLPARAISGIHLLMPIEGNRKYRRVNLQPVLTTSHPARKRDDLRKPAVQLLI